MTLPAGGPLLCIGDINMFTHNRIIKQAYDVLSSIPLYLATDKSDTDCFRRHTPALGLLLS